ncbi:hypothetical protein AHiyo1_17220 [Arthrobacter sp. Hiyo1]|nr:hypothetical protein AHiyo1_17220 [Arthrobacter sp. Hiyo1]
MFLGLKDLAECFRDRNRLPRGIPAAQFKRQRTAIDGGSYPLPDKTFEPLLSDPAVVVQLKSPLAVGWLIASLPL